MNKIIKTVKFFVLSCIVVSNITMLFAAPAKQPGALPGFPQMSEAEMKQLEAELGELNKMLEGLSPEEQEQVLDSMVQEAMEEVKKDLSDEGKELLDKLETGDISDEDFDKLLNELIPAPDKKPEEKPAPVEQKKPAPKAEPKAVVTNKHEEARDRIASLINHINLFIVKAGVIPELPGKIQRWEKKKTITWRTNLTWNSFKTELEKFVAQLNKLIEQDKKTKGYPHIDELLKNESLYNNLSKVEKAITQSEPKIEEVAPLGQKMSKESKLALQKTISQLTEALYTLALPQELTALFEKFAPTAQKKREAEEAATKKAAEESKKPRVPGKPVVAGTPEETPYYIPPVEDYDYPSYDSNFDYPQDFGSYGSTPSPSVPSSLPPSPADSEKSKSMPVAKSEEKKSSKSDVADQSKQEEKVSPQDAVVKQAIKMEQDRIKKSMGQITDALEDVAVTIKSSKQLQNLKSHLTSNQPVNKEINTAASVIAMGSAKTITLIDNLHNQVTEPRAVQNRKAELQKAYNKNKKEFDQLIQDLNEAEQVQSSISFEKQAAYFGEKIDKMDQFSKVFEELGMPNRIEEIKEIKRTMENQSPESVEAALKKLRESFSEEEIQKIDKLFAAQASESITLPMLKKALMAIEESIASFDKKSK